MRPYKTTRLTKQPIKAEQLREWRQALREAFRFYRIDHGRQSLTATELRLTASQTIKAARRFVETPCWDTGDQLLTQMEADQNVDRVIRDNLRVGGDEWVIWKYEFRHFLAFQAFMSTSPSELASKYAEFEPLARRVAALDDRGLLPTSGRWPDPALFALICRVAPIWEEITGRTAARVTNRDSGTKAFYFAKWIEDAHHLLGIENYPPSGRVLDIVLFQKNRCP